MPEDPGVSDRDPARLFLALWPEALVRRQLAAYRDAWRWPPGARPVADETLHVTLHFIGAFARACVPALVASLACVPVPRMRLRAGAAEVWKGGIAVLRVDGGPALMALHARLGALLSQSGVALDERPFSPHVTLARKAAAAVAPGATPTLAWSAGGFALVESVPGAAARYEVMERFPAS